MAAHGAETSPVKTDINSTAARSGSRRMPYGGSRMLAAAFHSIGLDARVTPEEDSRTLELGGKYTSGDECYPQRIVLGDYMKLLEDERLDPKTTAFLLPTANGPCRFGQYVSLLRRILDDQGYEEVPIVSFTSANGYADLGEQASALIRTAWRSVVVQDILLKLLLMIRPYEVNPGQTDKVYLECLDLMGEIVGRQGLSNKERMVEIRTGLREGQEGVPGHPGEEGGPPAHRRGGRDLLPPQHLLQQRAHPPHRGAGRRVLADRHRRMGLVHQRRGLPPPPRGEDAASRKEWLRTFITSRLMHRDEKALMADFEEVFERRPEPHVTEVLKYAAAVPAAVGGARRDGALHRAAPSPSTTGEPTASSTSARSPA